LKEAWDPGRVPGVEFLYWLEVHSSGKDWIALVGLQTPNLLPFPLFFQKKKLDFFFYNKLTK
jgi:hypothetical protein